MRLGVDDDPRSPEEKTFGGSLGWSRRVLPEKCATHLSPTVGHPYYAILGGGNPSIARPAFVPFRRPSVVPATSASAPADQSGRYSPYTPKNAAIPTGCNCVFACTSDDDVDHDDGDADDRSRRRRRRREYAAHARRYASKQ